MNELKERRYRKNIEELFAPFFALHPTKDLNVLFNSLLEDEGKEWSIYTDKTTKLATTRLSERVDLHFSLRLNEIRGYYELRQTKNYKIEQDDEKSEEHEKEKEQLHRYPVVLTLGGIRVREDAAVDQPFQERIEQFKFLIQLIDLSESAREGLTIESGNISEREGYRKYESRFSYELGYAIDNDHEIIEVIKDHFDIESALNQEKVDSKIRITGRCAVDDADAIVNQNYCVLLRLGEYGEVGTVEISGAVGFLKRDLL